ncbi:hypothetical protein CLG_B2283 [Clostridium phage D-1873]|uniref:Uncharacterized protein n=1 Tax=Clostridium botulinum D str. 1873 TaxID=592027 RepID=A0A9P2G5F7_CLOBO|nr:hypothetical protein [Clostridium botulinum]EES90327.1 hypothetical protein CLG_B2283 [Clostridium phage D-1873]MCD3245305.1 hypothetical protein [Clostridium botulinum C]MCD3261684.1 hypothetical protein [Clostridium botulinum C]QPW56450.1 hypothetical protein IRP61_11265 [Clostridium botulinum]
MVELNKDNENINIDEIKLKTLANIPTKITQSITIYPLTLKEIVMLGYDIYNQSLNYVCINIDDINDKNEELSNITTLDFIINNCIKNASFRNIFLNSLSLFLRSKIHLFNNKLYVSEILEDNIITDKILKDIQTIVKIQNSIDKKKENEFNVKSKKAREILAKLKKGKKKLQKSNKNNDLTLFDLVSIYCSYNQHTNITNIWDYNMFQFNDQFQRMQILEQYNINIQALLQGAEQNGESPTFIKKLN